MTPLTNKLGTHYIAMIEYIFLCHNFQMFISTLKSTCQCCVQFIKYKMDVDTGKFNTIDEDGHVDLNVMPLKTIFDIIDIPYNFC